MKENKRDAGQSLASPETPPTFVRISVEEKGEEVAFAEIDFFRVPFRFCYIARIEVFPHARGKRYASNMMDKIESYIKGKGVPGILIDTIERDSPAYGMYLRRGWKPFAAPNGQDLYVFNRGLRSDKKLAEAFQACGS